MDALKAIAHVLDYPNQAVHDHIGDLADVICDAPGLGGISRRLIQRFAEDFAKQDLLDVQARYVETFDRGRAVSLYLFEHVHGESRDRGQAMVDLLNVYREHRFEVAVNELPDYLPLFLEFCAYLDKEERAEWISVIEPMLHLLFARLEDRESDYAVVFRAMLEVLGLPLEDESADKQVAHETRDDTPEALDKAWAEEPVKFGPEAAPCPSARPQPKVAPVRQDIGIRRQHG